MIHTPLLSPVLVGRDAELGVLQEMLERAVGGQGATALIGGDAGIGKSRLCRALKGRAAESGVRLVEGRCSPAESTLPYGPFLDALRFRLGRGENGELAETLDPILDLVAPLFSELSAVAAGDGVVEAERRGAAATAMPFERIFLTLRRLATTGPMLLLLEDIHWADSTSRDLLHYLARQVGGEPILLLATYRTDELHPGHPVHRLVATLGRERMAQRIQLEPLLADDVRSMLAAMLDSEPAPEFAETVRERTEGNPLFIEELVTALAHERPEQHPDYTPADLADAGVPPTIHEIVLGRIEPMGEDTVEALTVAAVIGRRFRFDTLQHALDWSENRLLPIVEGLVRHRILVELSGRSEDRFAFRHSLVQEVLLAGVIGRRRRQWHRRIAAALERYGGESALPHTTLAYHYGEGGELSRAREHAILAGDEAVRLCAWHQAELMYERALQVSEQEPPNTALQATLLEKMTEVAWWQDRTGALEQYAQEALSLRRSLGEAPPVAALLRRLAHVYAYQKGELPRAIAALEEALEVLDSADACAELALVTNDLGRVHLAQGDYAAAEACIGEALEVAVRHGDGAEEALARTGLARLAILRGQIGAGRARLDEARGLLNGTGLSVERTAEAYHSGIRALESAREHAATRAWIDAALDHAAAHELHAEGAIYDAYRAAVDRRAGRWGDALETARSAVHRLREAGRAELREALRILGDLHRVRGEVPEARAAYEEAVQLGELDARVGLAVLLVAEERPEEAVDRLVVALDSHPAGDRLHALRILPHLAETAVRAGRLEEALAARDRLAEVLSKADYRAGPAALAHVDGLVRSACGQDGATSAFEESARAWTALELPHEAARARLELAAHRIRGGDDPGIGIQLARETLSALEVLGAGEDVARARRLLRDAGAGAPTPVASGAPTRNGATADGAEDPPSPLDQLTDREREVLIELAKGSTNKQIGRALSIAAKTVGNHVSSILAKLDCSTRTEASRIALAARFGGIPERTGAAARRRP